LHEVLTSSGSHQGRSTPTQHGKIHKWIEDGALNN